MKKDAFVTSFEKKNKFYSIENRHYISNVTFNSTHDKIKIIIIMSLKHEHYINMTHPFSIMKILST
jgi:hypothetical protein